jgi:Malectin domain
MSASSLRYYGFGLENGNYTVKLQFAETGFPNPLPYKWESLGRRIFDIYIQVLAFLLLSKWEHFIFF